MKKVLKYIAIIIALLLYAIIAYVFLFSYTPIGYILWITLVALLYIKICKNVPKVFYYISILIMLFFMWQEYYYGGIRGPMEWSITDRPIDYPSQWNNCYPLYRWSTYLFLCITNGGVWSIIIIEIYRMILCIAKKKSVILKFINDEHI